MYCTCTYMLYVQCIVCALPRVHFLKESSDLFFDKLKEWKMLISFLELHFHQESHKHQKHAYFLAYRDVNRKNVWAQ